MELLSLHSADELSFVQSLVTLAVTTPRYNWRLPSSGVTKVWIGLERTLQGHYPTFHLCLAVSVSPCVCTVARMLCIVSVLCT